MASTDNHYGNPGYGYLKILHDWDRQEIGTSAVAVYAAARTREAIFHALYDRRCYATTGDRIVLHIEADGRPMGSEYRSTTAPRIVVEAVGTSKIVQVEILRSGSLVHSVAPHRLEVRCSWTDTAFREDRPCYYVVRVVQDNGELAVASPIWVN
jgi:hypothetical protein